MADLQITMDLGEKHERTRANVTDNVVGLHGPHFSECMGKTNEEAVNKARKLLEQTEAGEVVGFAVARMHADQSTSYGMAGAATRSLVGVVFQMLHELRANVEDPKE